jgi:type IV secretory pathway VirD2 relaxase
MRAAKKAGHTGKGFGRRGGNKSRSTFGRGRRAALALSGRTPGRRVVIMSRIVRHQGKRFRSAPLTKHMAYLKREGVTRDGQDARMFDDRSDDADSKAFAERCEDDRHHFRFTVSPEDAPEMEDLRAFTRELMADAERDLGTKLDWVAVDHWNTDNPHIHVLVRGQADDGKDLVISRAYISQGFRDRASERVTMELGPRSELEIRSALEKEIDADRWTSLDRTLRDAADEGAGIADLRPGASTEDPELRRLMLGRAATLERLGLAEQVAPACWTLKPGLEQTLHDLAIRSDIIKTMHRAMAGAGHEPDVGDSVGSSAGRTSGGAGRDVDRPSTSRARTGDERRWLRRRSA